MLDLIAVVAYCVAAWILLRDPSKPYFKEF